MTVDTSIYGLQKPVQVESPLNALAQVLQLQQAQQQGQMGQAKLDEYQRGVTAQNALSKLLSTPGFDPSTAVGKQQLYGISPTAAQTFLKSNADVSKVQADADSAKFKLASDRYAISQKAFGSLANRPDLTKDMVLQTASDLVKQGIGTPEMLAALPSTLHDDPETLRADLKTRVSTQLTPEQILTTFAPKPDKIDNGQKIVFRDMNPNSPTYGQETGGTPVQRVATPGEVLNSQNQAAQRTQAERHFKITREDKQKENEVDPTTADSEEKTAQGIASSRIAPLSSVAMLRPAGARIMSRVLEINPTYDAGEYLSKNKALRDFGTGTQGLAVQAANTGLNHLDTIEQLAKAQKNGDIRAFNTLANRLGAETGQAAPTNLASAITMVAPEVSKMVIGAAGGQEERATFAKNFNPNASPDQTIGGIGTIRKLLGGRLSESQRTYERTTGRKDFSSGMLSPAAQKVLSAESPAQANDVPDDISALLKKHGGK